ncbi:MAG: carboxypeptidase-like regulatory domain-containing protein [Pseudomonadota bacterium]
MTPYKTTRVRVLCKALLAIVVLGTMFAISAPSTMAAAPSLTVKKSAESMPFYKRWFPSIFYRRGPPAGTQPAAPDKCTDNGKGAVELYAGASNSTTTHSDVCINDKKVKKYSCDNNKLIEKDIDCDSDRTCKDGACQQKSCEDNDGGKNTAVAGTVTEKIGGTPVPSLDEDKNDKCVNQDQIKEFYCDGSNKAFEITSCPAGQVCSTGACVTGDKYTPDMLVYYETDNCIENPLPSDTKPPRSDLIVFVTDLNGGSTKDASVQFAANCDDNYGTPSKTDVTGEAQVPGLSNGPYCIKVTHPNFNTFEGNLEFPNIAKHICEPIRYMLQCFETTGQPCCVNVGTPGCVIKKTSADSTSAKPPSYTCKNGETKMYAIQCGYGSEDYPVQCINGFPIGYGDPKQSCKCDVNGKLQLASTAPGDSNTYIDYPLFCADKAQSGTFVQPVGGPCNIASDCGSDNICSGGTCFVADGNPCTTDGNCLSGSCDQQKKCALIPAVMLKKNGDTCSDASECSSGFCEKNVCGKAMGDSCSSNGECTTNFCKVALNYCVYKPIGALTCEGDFECAPGSSCADQQGHKACRWGDGGSCTGSGDCVSGNCSGGKCAQAKKQMMILKPKFIRQ